MEHMSKSEFLMEDGHARPDAERADAADTLCRYLESQAVEHTIRVFTGWPSDAAHRERVIRDQLARAKTALAAAVEMGIDRKTSSIESRIYGSNTDGEKDGVIENIEDFFFIYRMAIKERRRT